MAGMAREGAASFGSLRQVRLGRDGRFGLGPVRTGMVWFGRSWSAGRAGSGGDWTGLVRQAWCVQSWRGTARVVRHGR